MHNMGGDLMANKQKIKQEDVHKTEELIKVGREQVEAEVARLKTELEITIEEREAIGILKKTKTDRAYNDLIEAIVLYRMKESKAYKRLGFPWARFCELAGCDVKQADRIISDARPIFEAFSDNLSNLSGLDLNDIRLLGRSVSDNLSNLSEIKGGIIEYKGQKFPLAEAATIIKDLEGESKARERLIQQKQKALDDAHHREGKLTHDLSEAKKSLADDRKRLYGDVIVKFKDEDQHAIEQLHYAHDQIWLAMTSIASIDKEKTSVDLIVIAKGLCKHIRILAEERFTEIAIARPDLPDEVDIEYWDEKLPFNAKRKQK